MNPPRTELVVAIALLAACGCAGGERDGAGRGDEPPWFAERAAESGLDFEHRSGADGRFLLPEIMAGGAALFDMDGDGDLDAYLVQSDGVDTDPARRRPNRLFANRGDGTFQDVSQGSGAEDPRYGMGVAAGDYDNDGDTDLYVTNLGRNTLLQNDGNGRFSDVTETSGTGDRSWGSSAAFFDYDRDGDLDLFVANYIRWAWNPGSERVCRNPLGARDYCAPKTYRAPATDLLYRNEGDGRFSDVTEEAGIAAAFGNGLGVAVADFAGDGWLDVFVANDGHLDQLWRNRGDSTFVDEALLAGCAIDQEGTPKAGMGIAVGDVDSDGDPDLMVCNIFGESDSYYRNDGRYFTDVTARAGLGSTSRRFTRFGLGWVDFDNDGRLDLYQANGRVKFESSLHSDDPFAEPNLLFRGVEGDRFEELRPRGGTEPTLFATSRAAAFGDVDGDGGVDVLVVNRDHPAYLLRNVVPDRGHWIALRVLNAAGSDALHASVTVDAGDRRRYADVRPDSSYLAASSPIVHVGLGDTDEVRAVEVRWLDGRTQRFGPLAVDRLHVLERPAD